MRTVAKLAARPNIRNISLNLRELFFIFHRLFSVKTFLSTMTSLEPVMEEVALKKEEVKVLSTTTSVCPECNAVIPAERIESDGKIFMKKTCPAHGEFTELYFGDAEMYHRFSKYAHDGKGVSNPQVKELGYTCPLNCGLCPGHMSHTALANIVVTNRCNLACWYCLPPDEELLVKDGDGVRLLKIGELASRFFGRLESRKAYEGEYVEPSGVYVLSFGKERVKWSRVKRIFRRKYSGAIYQLITKTGRRIRLTQDHRVLVLRDGKLKRLPVAELTTGENILIVGDLDLSGEANLEINLVTHFKKLPPEEQKKIYLRGNISQKLIYDSEIGAQKIYGWNHRGSAPLYAVSGITEFQDLRLGVDAVSYELPTILVLSPELMELMGYFISDGHYTYKDLRITVGDEYIAKRLEEVLEKLGLPHSWLRLDRYGKTPQLVIGSRLLRLVFTYVFKIPAGACNKRLPGFVFNLPLKHKISLLSALFNGDGYVVRGSRNCSLGYATTSSGLARDMLYLLSSLGIFARLYKVPANKMKGARHDLYKIYISGRDLERVVSILKLRPAHLRKLKDLSPRRDTRPPRFGDLLIDEVKEIIPESSGEEYEYVYDLEVDDQGHSFIAGDGILVSNCFFYAERAGYVYEPSIEEIRRMVRVLRSMRPVAGNSVQLTGGEPTLRDDLPEIIKMIREEGVDHVMLNTNGIRLANDFEYYRRVKEAGVSNLYLSMDGVTPETNPKNYWEIPKILENARKLNDGIVFVPTVIKTVNDHELGDIVRFGFENVDVVRAVNFQPVSLTGMMPRKERERFRITIPDCIHLIEEQTDGQIPADAWFPVPACVPVTHLIEAFTKEPKYELSVHFACGAGTYVFKDGDRMIPITNFIDVDGLLKYLQDRADEVESGRSKAIAASKILWNFRKFIDEKRAPTGMNVTRMLLNVLIKHDYKSVGDWHRRSMFIGMMHFQDKYNYDVERVRRCAIHYLMPDGRIVPFCAFNILPEWYRDLVQKMYSIPIEEWERRTGRKLSDDIYRRVLPSKE